MLNIEFYQIPEINPCCHFRAQTKQQQVQRLYYNTIGVCQY